MRLNCTVFLVLIMLCSGCAPGKASFSTEKQAETSTQSASDTMTTSSHPSAIQPTTLRIATFNASMDGSNYVEHGDKPIGNELVTRLANGNEQQIKNVAEIIQRVRPDILLINEFDYVEDPQQGVLNFQQHYLSQSQQGQKPIDYPYYFVAPVNTGVPVTYQGAKGEHDPAVYGFGYYPGQYGMVILSRYPIVTEQARTFQHFLWKDMPGSLLPGIVDEKGNAWYSEVAQSVLRLSSKSHWDVPVRVGQEVVHVLTSHPTPPVFDGAEDRNGKRNHDEVRFWTDYLNGEDYFYDDNGKRGGFSGESFVIMGDLNSSPVEGDALGNAIGALISHPLVNGVFIPESEGGKSARIDNPHSASHTAGWGMRADYTLPSKAGWEIERGGVFWPVKNTPEYRLIESRKASSDHRLVWVEMRLDKL